jgi:hypothetical protein
LLVLFRHSLADASAADAGLLGTTLTPVGAERAGNQDGSIPAWTGGVAEPSPGYVEGAPRPDPFAREKPLFSITAANYRQYEDKLPEGQKALFDAYSDYRMDIYATHRSAALPASVYAAIAVNAVRARPAREGINIGITGAVGGIPFPIPDNGTEVVWNHLLAFWGAAREDDIQNFVMSAEGTLDLTNEYHETIDFPYYYPDAKADSFGGYYFKRKEISRGPPGFAGRGYLLWQPQNIAEQPVQAWQYLPRERRVRKSPLLAYDTPTPDGGGILSFDDYYVFSGAPDRYQFTLLGKREMFVPYNNNGFAGLPIASVAKPRHIAPDALRYELHRVWVVDGVLAPGKSHLAPHRRLYIDEDSWFAVYCDAWDRAGHLWKFSQGLMYLVPDLPAVVLGSQVTYDLQDGGYALAFSFNDEPVHYRVTAIHPESAFSPESLAGEGVR